MQLTNICMQAIGERGSMEVALPEIEHLKINYRTHAGIINVAASVVDLIRRFFPQVQLLWQSQAYGPASIHRLKMQSILDPMP